MVMPGATTRKPRVKRLLFGCRTALMVCHAMSMAMTVVLPAPVANFRAKRDSSGVGVVAGVGEAFKEAPSSRPVLRRNLGQPDDGLCRLYLAEEGLDIAEVVVSPMLE